jgi:hypothetical protein
VVRLASRVSPHVPHEDPELAFYASVMTELASAHVQFLVGGAAGLQHHTGICKDTKDLDLFLRERDVQRALHALEAAGLETEIAFPHWLAKARLDERFVDLIYNSGNGATPVDDAWFARASHGTMLGRPVAFCPVEETIWSKSFVMERERYDGADVAHLLAARAKTLDWKRLVARYGRYWRVLLSHLVLFQFIYPDLAHDVPDRVMDELLERLRVERQTVTRERMCLGTLISREQFLVDLEAGRRDGRLPPTGHMHPADVAAWTAAIGATKP